MTGTVAAVHPLARASRLRGSIRLPGDKSIAHRALMFGAMASGDAIISIRHPGHDVLSTVGALRALGAFIGEDQGVGPDDPTSFRVAGRGDHAGVRVTRDASADCANSGSTMRLLAGLAASGRGEVELRGDASLSRRPMERVATPLRRMGAAVETTHGHAPIVIRGNRPLAAMEHRLEVASAQVLGAVAIAALSADGQTVIRAPGATRDHTERLLRWLGAGVGRVTDPSCPAGTVTTVRGPSMLAARSLEVPGDISSAAAWIVAATVHPDADIELLGVGLNPTRLGLVDALREMGGDIEVRPRHTSPDEDTDSGPEPVGDLRVRSASRLSAITLQGDRIAPLIDELPLLAVAMATADGTSEVRGAAELRVKESDRIATLAAALRAGGVRVEEAADGWRIGRGPALPASVLTAGDHRIAMAMAVAAWAGVVGDVALDDPDCVAISYPTFWRDAAVLGATG